MLTGLNRNWPVSFWVLGKIELKNNKLDYRNVHRLSVGMLAAKLCLLPYEVSFVCLYVYQLPLPAGNLHLYSHTATSTIMEAKQQLLTTTKLKLANDKFTVLGLRPLSLIKMPILVLLQEFCVLNTSLFQYQTISYKYPNSFKTIISFYLKLKEFSCEF